METNEQYTDTWPPACFLSHTTLELHYLLNFTVVKD